MLPAAYSIERIKVEPSTKLGDILRDVQRGKLRIPRFQREFVWERAKVVRLLDSVYRQFPIGTFFFWEAPRKYNKFFRNIAELNISDPDAQEDITFVLDGQQRITSLYAVAAGLTLNGADYGQICFDLDQGTFETRPPDNTRYVSVRDLLNDAMIQTVYDPLTPERRRRFIECRLTLMNYPFSVVRVKDVGLDDACDIFERINQEGKRLSLADLIVARTWSENFDLRQKMEELNRLSVSKGFGDLEVEVVTESLSLAINGSCTRSAQMDLSTENVGENWSLVIESLFLAIDYLRTNLGVKRYSYVPYRAQVSLLAYYFYKSGNRAVHSEHKDLIDRWFWRTSFSERYGTSGPTRMGEDRKILDAVIGGQRTLIPFPPSVTAEAICSTQMKTDSAIKKAVICLLALGNPRHFKSGALLPLDDSYFSEFNTPERHHIFPNSFLKARNIDEFSLANFTFIPAELNKEISDSEPKTYFSELKKNKEFQAIMDTHYIPVDDDSGIWTNEYTKFINQRAEMLMRGIGQRLGPTVQVVTQSTEVASAPIPDSDTRIKAS